MAAENKTHSGCTAVAAFLRIEDESGGQSYITRSPITNSSGVLTEEPSSTASSSEDSLSRQTSTRSGTSTPNNGGKTGSGRTTPSDPNRSPMSGAKLRSAMRNLTSKFGNKGEDSPPPTVKGVKRPPFEPDWTEA